MDHHALEYYTSYSDEMPHGNFHRVIALHDEPVVDWQEASALAPDLCRGWYELAKLTPQDRIEFTREFWIAKMPYHPKLTEFLISFFESIDDIGVYLTQKTFEAPFEVSMVYSLADNGGFYHGLSGANQHEIVHLQNIFPNFQFPIDYLSFLQIHNGFAKLKDTGLFGCFELKDNYNCFQGYLLEQADLTTTKGAPVNPKSLIPFYQSYNLPFYQCFWAEWYPDLEMGNVYYSDTAKTISVCSCKGECAETMAFETFSDWLMFYLEKIE